MVHLTRTVLGMARNGQIQCLWTQNRQDFLTDWIAEGVSSTAPASGLQNWPRRGGHSLGKENLKTGFGSRL